MFEVHALASQGLRHHAVADLTGMLSACLLWPLGLPERYDVNTSDQWRAFSMHPWCADALGQRVQVVRVVCTEGLIAIDGGHASGQMRWILAGKGAPPLAQADAAAAALVTAGMERVWIHHPPSTAAFRTNYPTADPERAHVKSWTAAGGDAGSVWPSWGSAPDAALLASMSAQAH